MSCKLVDPLAFAKLQISVASPCPFIFAAHLHIGFSLLHSGTPDETSPSKCLVKVVLEEGQSLVQGSLTWLYEQQ